MQLDSTTVKAIIWWQWHSAKMRREPVNFANGGVLFLDWFVVAKKIGENDGGKVRFYTLPFVLQQLIIRSQWVKIVSGIISDHFSHRSSFGCFDSLNFYPFSRPFPHFTAEENSMFKSSALTDP